MGLEVGSMCLVYAIVYAATANDIRDGGRRKIRRFWDTPQFCEILT